MIVRAESSSIASLKRSETTVARRQLAVCGSAIPPARCGAIEPFPAVPTAVAVSGVASGSPQAEGLLCLFAGQGAPSTARRQSQKALDVSGRPVVPDGPCE